MSKRIYSLDPEPLTVKPWMILVAIVALSFASALSFALGRYTAPRATAETGAQGTAQKRPREATAAKPLTKQEALALLTGKSEDEVIKAFGRPDTTQSLPASVGGEEWWVYNENRQKIWNPVTQKPVSCIVVFRGGQVTNLR